MNRTSVLASVTAAIAGVVVAIALALASGAAVGQTTPSTDLGKVNADNGFLQGSQAYGERDDSGDNK